MGHVDGRDAPLALQALDFGAHLFAQLRIEIPQRFVEQQQLWLTHQGAGQGQALLLTTGQLGGRAVGTYRAPPFRAPASPGFDLGADERARDARNG